MLCSLLAIYDNNVKLCYIWSWLILLNRISRKYELKWCFKQSSGSIWYRFIKTQLEQKKNFQPRQITGSGIWCYGCRCCVESQRPFTKMSATEVCKNQKHTNQQTNKKKVNKWKKKINKKKSIFCSIFNLCIGSKFEDTKVLIKSRRRNGVRHHNVQQKSD